MQFENWLKANGYVTFSTYSGYMNTIEKTLLIKDFETIDSVTVLKALFDQLQATRTFAARNKSDRDNILSGFRAYIKFITEKKQRPSGANEKKAFRLAKDL